MARFSLIEWSNEGRTFVEEVAVTDLIIEDSLFGFIKTATFTVAAPAKAQPILAAGTHTAGTSTTVLTDSTADFRAALVQPGDVVQNTTDSNALWEVVTVDSKTALTVQLTTSGGGDDDFDTSDVYSLFRRNPENTYIPFQTCVRITGREIEKVLFRGEVQETLPGEGQGRLLKIIAVNKMESVRDSMPQTDIGSADARSAVIQDALNQQSSGSGSFLFPFVSNYGGNLGIEHSPNLKQIQPDFSKINRGALANFIDFGKSEFWCPDVLREPTASLVSLTPSATSQELVQEAQGSLAQSFQISGHALVAKVILSLIEIGTFEGNIYVRIEANDPRGDTAGNDIPSGDLVTPWAESTLVNGDIGGSLADVSFVFPRPIALRDDTTYWIVLQYQEENENFSTGVNAIEWEDATGGSQRKAVYSSGAWVAAAGGEDLMIEVIEYADAVWLWDNSSDAWTDQTTEAASAAASTFVLFPSGASQDRYYIRTAGPIRGLDFVITGAATGEFGNLRVRYFATDRPKITGLHTGGTSTTVLTDATKDFRLSGVVVGDILYNRDDRAYGVITAIAQTTLTVDDLASGTNDNFQVGDSYAVVNLEERLTGSATSGTSDQLVDSGADFEMAGVREGDLVVNTTDNRVGVITAYSTTTIDTDTSGLMAWDGSDGYTVLSRWRTLTLKENNTTFVVTGTTRMEWEIQPDFEATFFEAGMPEALSPTALTNLADMRGYFISIEPGSVPGTTPTLEQIIPLPGTGFSLRVKDTSREEVILAAGGSHDGAGDNADLIDSSEDFILTHGIKVGDIVENITDGSRGVVTGIVTGTSLNDTVVATLSGGSQNDWDVADEYRFLRDRYQLRYFRNGSCPLGGPANYGLTLRQGSPTSKQIKQIFGGSFSESTRSLVNRVRIVGRTTGGALVNRVVDDLRSQREQGRVVQRVITDLSIKTDAEADERAIAELVRLGNRSRRGTVEVFNWPFFTRVRERQNWFIPGLQLIHKLDGSGAGLSGIFTHTTGASAAALLDADNNFKKWGVEAGDLVTNVTDGSTATIISVSTTTDENDTVNGALSGGTEDDWDVGDEYRIEQRDYVQIGDLVQVKVNDPSYIDDNYLVVGIHYHEPSFKMILRVAKNLIAPAVGDQQSQREVIQSLSDTAQRGSQRPIYD